MKTFLVMSLITMLATGQATGSAQVIYASRVAGVTLDGVSGCATSHDNTALINAQIAALSVGSELIIDGLSCATSIRQLPGVKINGLGPDTGFISIPGTTRPLVWTGDNCQPSYNVCGTPPAQALNFQLSNLSLDCAGIVSPNLTSWEPCLNMLNTNGVVLDKVVVKNATSYGYYFSNSTNIALNNVSCFQCLIDGWHFSGLTSSVFGRGLTYVGAAGPGGYDDCIGINGPESYHGPITNIDIDGINCTNVRTFARIYGAHDPATTTLVSNIYLRNGHGSNVTDLFFKLGLEASAGAPGPFSAVTLDNITIDNFEAGSADRKQIAFIHESFGKVRFSRVTSKPANAEVFEIKAQSGTITGDLFDCDHCVVYRDSTDSTAMLTLTNANLGLVSMPNSGVALKQGYAHTAVDTTFAFTNGTIGRLIIPETIFFDFVNPFSLSGTSKINSMSIR